MICPYCRNEMEKGYVDQTDFRHPLIWYPAKREPGFFRSVKDDVKLTTASSGALAVHRCRECKKFIIDMEEAENAR